MKSKKMKKMKKRQRAYLNRCHRMGYKPYRYDYDGGPLTAVYGEWIVSQRGSLVAKAIDSVLSDGDYRETIGVVGSDGKSYMYYDGFDVVDRGPKPRKRSRKRLLALGMVRKPSQPLY